MRPDSSSTSEVSGYVPLPNGERDSPEWQAARELNERAQAAQGRLALGCFLVWLDDGSYVMTGLPPMGDVRGSSTVMTIFTAEHLVTIRGANLHLLVWAMKEQRIDDLRATESSSEAEDNSVWVITSITAEPRNDE